MGERLMKLEGPVLAVRDLQASLVFYQTVLGLEIIRGFGDSVELEGGLSLQTLDSWAGSLGRAPQDIRFDGGDSELYFVTEDFDQFLRTLGDMPGGGAGAPSAGAPLGPADGTAVRPGWAHPGDSRVAEQGLQTISGQRSGRGGYCPANGCAGGICSPAAQAA